ncbi:sodium:solute symporter family transporter [Rhodopirellula sp. MGV]|uniref:sodium:solute symporter family transporter n=1 Tax=Rhodopirellula sp. MGV TaxID=2023130 RepID=UPI000B96C3D7|nr:kelch repeat-containing protein [Rhodopirellula sp. MGV]OYP35036.1 sodium:solute symporter [Rhodopirellula sp. MGV]PNY35797.1 sodium:solute symporter [Rhodopirellula baltica]
MTGALTPFGGKTFVWLGLVVVAASLTRLQHANAQPSADRSLFSWSELPPLPDPLGVAGPFAGVHNDALIVAGGANFPKPVWDSDKVWHDSVYVLHRHEGTLKWHTEGKLPRNAAYGAAVSCDDGVLCIGGNDGEQAIASTFLLQWDPVKRQINRVDYPDLPQPCAYGSAAMIGNTVYLFGGQADAALSSAGNQLYVLDLSLKDQPENFAWKRMPDCPVPTRAFHLTIAQHNGFQDCLYVIGGRRQSGPASTDVTFLSDVWEFQPTSGHWRQRSDAPRPIVAGIGIGIGQSHIGILGGDDGSLFFKSDELKDQHPGFPRQALAYHTITDTWTSAGEMPASHVTTIAVRWNDQIIIPSGEVRPRVRSAKVWSVKTVRSKERFGWMNNAVLVTYLLAMVGVGLYFARKNHSTNDYFRGGQSIPWWAAGCSIFATMLSSLTFTGIPSKAFAQDWVYAVGNLMIPVVALLAVFVAMPFYRRIDATSAYEYLERRFSRPVRWFGSASFTLFHVFRMAVVMSLTGLALAVATPLTPAQSVMLMGGLSLLYCTMGGVEAVIWTDTLQTVVLLGGAVLAVTLLIIGSGTDFSGVVMIGNQADKFSMVNLHGDVTGTSIALWVIVIGAIAQNVSSYTADQAVVQRYMTTADQRLAARSIWTNAVLTVPATILFFSIGTGLYVFYRAHPEKLDPTITTDQIFPLFIAREMPIGIAGLIVAGVFAAAQSTVSTSMNSVATTIVTDFLRPCRMCRTDQAYLRVAQGCTLLVGVIGTLLGLAFVDPEIKSLFDAFIKVIGLFMGVLGGLFMLGAFTRRANATGAMTGALVGAAMMVWLWLGTNVNGYLYTACGITTCFVVGYIASLFAATPKQSLAGLTVYDMRRVG